MNANENWGVTSLGFYRPHYDEILQWLELKAIDKFGQGINFGDRTLTGLFIRLAAWCTMIVYMVAEGVYNSMFVATSYGASLYHLGKQIGITPLTEQRAVGEVLFTGTPGRAIPAGTILATTDGTRFLTTERRDIGTDGTVRAPIRAEIAGVSGNVAAGAITRMITALAGGGITSVTNEENTIGGRNRETEDEFRTRYEDSVDLPGGSNTDAIRAELLRTDAVLDANVFENTTDHYDENGLPPHSVEAVVYGGSTVDIIAAIFDRKAAGIQTFGNQSGTITDDSGDVKKIFFSRPEPVEVYARVNGIVTTSPRPLDFENYVKAAIISHIGGKDAAGNDVSGLGIGQDIIFNKVVCPINAIDGMIEYEFYLSVDSIAYDQENIRVGTRNIAEIIPDRIEVVLT